MIKMYSRIDYVDEEIPYRSYKIMVILQSVKTLK